MQSEGDEGGICVVAESCHQTSEAVGLMASTEKMKDQILFLLKSIRSARLLAVWWISLASCRPPEIALRNPTAAVAGFYERE